MEPSSSAMMTANRLHNPIFMGLDAKEVAKWERKRESEQTRKERIFNTKNRAIGVDVSMLEKQVLEKVARRRLEQLENKKQGLLAERLALKAMEEAERKEKEKRKLMEEINNFRLIHQKKEYRREYDLDKLLCLNEPKIGGDDCRWGVTVFEGEDANLKERIKQQQEQQKAWLAQQMQEKKDVNFIIHDTERKQEFAAIEKDLQSVQLERIEKACKLKMDNAVAEYNAALARQKLHEKQQMHRKEDEWNTQEIINTLTSDFMQETPILAKSSLGPNRINPMMYKKMPDEIVEEIRETQKKQIQEHEERKIREKYEIRSWDSYNDFVLKTTSYAERELEQKLKDQMDQMDFPFFLGKRQKENLKYINDVLYSNKITEDFFNKFNTSSR